MKIAICISGHVRNMIPFYDGGRILKITGEHIDTPGIIPIISKLKDFNIDYDVYISSWNTTGRWLEPTKLPYNDNIDQNQARLGIYEHERNLIDTSQFDKIENLVKCEVEDDTMLIDEIVDLSLKYKNIIEPGQFDMDREEQRKYQIFSMFRKCQRSIDLIENPEQYDLILRTRFDVTFDLNRVVSSIEDILNNNSILIPSNFEFGGENAEGGGRICDSFALGSPQNMTKYAKVYDFFKKSETYDHLNNNDIWFCPHSLLRQHLILNQVNYHRSDIDYSIIRHSDRVANNSGGVVTYTGQFSDPSVKSIWNKK